MLEALLFGLFGLIVGSFLNVLTLRWGIQHLGGRSACTSCGHVLSWQDLIPVLSWISLRGHCRYCSARISFQYPLVEVLTGVMFALVGASPLPLDLWYRISACVIVAILIAIAVYDLRHTIIPDPWVYLFCALSILTTGSIVLTLDNSLGIPQYLSFGPVTALPLFLLWLVSGGAWMGFGDVKLSLGFGWLLGPVYGLAAVFFAFMLGAFVSLAILLPLPHILRYLQNIGITAFRLSGEGFTMKSEIPFGPFLVASCLIFFSCWLYGIQILSVFGL